MATHYRTAGGARERSQAGKALTQHGTRCLAGAMQALQIECESSQRDAGKVLERAELVPAQILK